MIAVSRQIIEYISKNGKNHFKEWIDNQIPDVQKIVDSRMTRVRNGNLGDVKPVGEGVNEMRFHSGQGFRIYFGQVGSKIILLLTAGDKKNQDTNIELAKRLWREYQTEQRNASN
jgi:putative addiction module killer protein